MDITFDFGKLLGAVEKEPDYTIVGQAIHDSGDAVADAIRAALTGAVFPGMTRKVKKPNQADAVRHENLGLFEFSVQTPQEVEEAKPAYDMKPYLLRGPKHRVGKHGPYNIIPFTHKSAGMPEVVAQMAAQLTLSQIIGQRLEVRLDDQWEAMRNTYEWGSSLGKMPQEQKRYSNMYRFGDDKFITFRTVSSRSKPDSWWYPAQPANPVAESVWKVIAPAVEWKLTAAWREAIMKTWQ